VLAAEPAALGRKPVELRSSDQRRRAAADAVEERDHLRNGGHPHHPGRRDADHRPQRDPGQHQPVRVDLLDREGEADRDRHSDGGDQVPHAGRPRM
jgi:hypothetical protein